MDTAAKQQEMDFTMILVSTIHDVKNSLGLVLDTLDEVMGTCSPEVCKAQAKFSKLHYEAKRVSNDLVQLLALYKIGNDQLPCHIDHHSVADFLEECGLQNKPLLDINGITLETECDGDLCWFFDAELLSGVINNVINNALRYTKDCLRLTASEQDGGLILRVEDNGKGYPPSLLHSGADGRREISFKTGSTGLGLYFASTVAQMHENRGRHGYIVTANGGTYGGGCFTLFIP